jgi:hypothetical protein
MGHRDLKTYPYKSLRRMQSQLKKYPPFDVVS